MTQVLLLQELASDDGPDPDVVMSTSTANCCGSIFSLFCE